MVSFGPFVACLVDPRPMVHDSCHSYSSTPGDLQFEVEGDGRIRLNSTSALIAVESFTIIAAIMCPVGLLLCFWTNLAVVAVLGAILHCEYRACVRVDVLFCWFTALLIHCSLIHCSVDSLFCWFNVLNFSVVSRGIALACWISVVSDGAVWSSRKYGQEYAVSPNHDWLTMTNSGFTMQLVALVLELFMGVVAAGLHFTSQWSRNFRDRAE
jgi:hypothetical protein